MSQIDKRFIVDYLCKDNDIPGVRAKQSRIDINLNCRSRLLMEIALNLGISKDILRNIGFQRDTLCDIINKKIIELDIATNLAECKRNIALVQLKMVQTGKPDDLAQDFDELNRLYYVIDFYNIVTL